MDELKQWPTEHEIKLTLNELRRLRFPIRDKSGKLLWENRFKWRVNEVRGTTYYIHWELTFTLCGWEWGLELGPELADDREWTESQYVVLWLHNYDPNRFLVGLHLTTLQDLLRFLDAFKVEYCRVDGVEPVDYRGLETTYQC